MIIKNKRIRAMAAACCLLAASVLSAETVLYSGGDWDFEDGFHFNDHMLAGAIASPCGTHTTCDQSLCDGHVECIPADKWAGVANGWHHWASFPTWQTPGFWGVASFNENKNQANVSRGVRSQEITLTCANGIGLIYRTATVPHGHRIRVKARMKFTPNDPGWPDTEHSLGLDPTGGTNPNAESVQWFDWDENVPSPPQPSRVFNVTSETVDVFSNKLTIFIRIIAREPNCQGQTFMIDDVEVFDEGPLGPWIAISPAEITTSTLAGSDAPDIPLSVWNAGTGELSYAIGSSVSWMMVLPRLGSSEGQHMPAKAIFSTASLPPGAYEGAITVIADVAGNSPLAVPVHLTIMFKPGDFDADGDVDQGDFGRFQACLTGPGANHVPPGCEEPDLDDDNDVDVNDFALFQGCMSGADVASDPDCVP